MLNTASGNAPTEGSLVLASRREEINDAQEQVLAILDRCGYDRAALFAVRIAVGEALTNAMQHGNRQDPAKKVRLEFRVERTTVVIEVEDEGEGFDAEAVPDPTRDENVDLPSGRGIMLMRAYMTDIEFRPPGNRVRMVYKKA